MRSLKERGAAARARLEVECLEGRDTPSWGTIPPSLVPVPGSAVAVALSSTGPAAVSSGEVDWYRFTVGAGSYLFKATTPTSSVDTVIGLYDAAGRRVGYSDDVTASNTDSRLAINLAGGTYYLGVTNYTGTATGSYSWYIGVPTANSPPPGTFSITLRMSGLSAGQQAVFQAAANRWSQVITGDLPDATYNGVRVDDVLIDASGVDIDGPGNVLGQSSPDYVRGGTLLPIHGTMEFDTADLARLEANGGLYYVVLHEMAHVLGFGTIWEDRGLLYGAGTSNPLFVGPLATAVYTRVFGTGAAGVPVENSGGEGTADSHWRDSLFGNEVMTGYLDGGFNPLSRITVASMSDLGYSVNLAAADAYTPTSGAVALARSSGGTGGGTRLLAAALPVPADVQIAPAEPARGRPDQHPAADPPARGEAHAVPDWFEQLAARVAPVPANPPPPAILPSPELAPIDPFHLPTDLA